MRVVSMVPSWTETLIAAGVDVVGRTSFCVHPAEVVQGIEVGGGTKNVRWDKVRALQPDLIVLDREENPRSMADEAPVPWIATHITNVDDVAPALDVFEKRFGRPEFGEMAGRWRQVCASLKKKTLPGWKDLPGVIQWIREPSSSVDQCLYLIWREPWMAAGPGTFIKSMLRLVGLGERLVPLTEKYPKINPAKFDRRRTLLLCASEPYPFARHLEALRELGFAAVLVNGESYSWFGIRALRFLEHVKDKLG